MKRIKNNRKKQRDRIIQDKRQILLDNLARISEGKTPPEIVDAQVEYYETCDNASKLMLQEIFAKQEDEMQTKICQFFAEKDSE